jgi:hypothetical protein
MFGNMASPMSQDNPALRALHGVGGMGFVKPVNTLDPSNSPYATVQDWRMARPDHMGMQGQDWRTALMGWRDQRPMLGGGPGHVPGQGQGPGQVPGQVPPPAAPVTYQNLPLNPYGIYG